MLKELIERRLFAEMVNIDHLNESVSASPSMLVTSHTSLTQPVGFKQKLAFYSELLTKYTPEYCYNDLNNTVGSYNELIRTHNDSG